MMICDGQDVLFIVMKTIYGHQKQKTNRELPFELTGHREKKHHVWESCE
jgi:hypothetical protein